MAIIGSQNPIVGKAYNYQISESFSINDLLDSDTQYVWRLYKKKDGSWVDITDVKGKVGKSVPYTFYERAAGFTFRLDVYKAVKTVFSDEYQATKFASLELVPSSATSPKIKKVVLFNRGAKDPNKASYQDTLIAQAHCVGMFNQTVEFTLWEDDAAGEGHDANINKSNTTNTVFRDRVNEKGIAEVRIPLSSNQSVLKTIANKYLMQGDQSEGANHEYYVTASYAGKIQGSSQVNVNVANPDRGQKPKRDSFMGSGTSSRPPRNDAKGKIKDAYFVNSKNQRLSKAAIGTYVIVKILTENMKGKVVTLKVWEEDNGFDDVIFEKNIRLNEAESYYRVDITQSVFDKGYGTKRKVFGTPVDSDSVQQTYYIEIIPLDDSMDSKSFGLTSEGLMKVEAKRSPAVVKEYGNGTCLCESMDLYWGNFFTCQERKKIIDISRRLLCDPNYLTSAMALETGGKFDPSIVNSLGYTGLIQIGSIAAQDINRRKGTNVTAGNNGNLKNMSKLEQLTYVEYYLEPFKGKLNTLADFYLAILMPVDCGKGANRNHVVFDKNISLDYKDGKVVRNTKWVRQRAYEQNPVFHKEANEQGKTYVWEIAEEIESWYERGKNNKVSEFSCEEKAQHQPKENVKWHNPVDNPRLTKYNYSGIVKPASGTYGWCRRKSDGSKKYHSGFDFFAIPGVDKVYSCLKGNIHQVRYSESAGWIVRVKIQNVKDLLEQETKVSYQTQFKDELRGIDLSESDDVYFIYMHLDSVAFSAEDAASRKEVEAGTILGYAGVSGSIASGGKAPHLHLEIATVLDAYGKGESVRTNPARFVKLNPYNTADQDEAAKKRHN